MWFRSLFAEAVLLARETDDAARTDTLITQRSDFQCMPHMFQALLSWCYAKVAMRRLPQKFKRYAISELEHERCVLNHYDLEAAGLEYFAAAPCLLQ